MSKKLFACITSDVEPDTLLAIADQFAGRVERLEKGIVFDISGLHNLIGTDAAIAAKIARELELKKISANVAVSAKIESAILLAENCRGVSVDTPNTLPSLPLGYLPVDEDTRYVFAALGLKTVKDLKQIPAEYLVSRYGQDFERVLDLINLNGKRTLVPNIEKCYADWSYILDHPVDNFEQLIFILSHGLNDIHKEIERYGLSTEQIEITLQLEDGTEKIYTIKISFPSVEMSFWRKLIDLRISDNLPEAAIIGIALTAYFAKPRSVQMGLFSSEKPQPESLQLTIDKISKLVGKDQVGVPVLLNQRVSKPFDIDGMKMPAGKEPKIAVSTEPKIAFTYIEPPLPARVFVEDGRLVALRTANFSGRVKEYGGVWRNSSQWWNKSFWKAREWDVEIENEGVFLLNLIGDEWFVMGEYD